MSIAEMRKAKFEKKTEVYEVKYSSAVQSFVSH